MLLGKRIELVIVTASALHRRTAERVQRVGDHFVAINVLVGLATGDDRVVCFHPANASVTRLEIVDDGVQEVSLGREMTTVIN